MKKKWSLALLVALVALVATGANTPNAWAASGILTEPFWICADDQGRVTYARALHQGDPTDLEARTAAALSHKTMDITTKKGLAVPFCWEETVHIRNDEATP